MATIDKKLIHFNRKADFEARLAAGEIRDYSIVCIKDAKLIWTHGEYYGDLSECLTKYPQEFTKEEKDQMLENLGYYFIEWDGESETMELSEEEYAKLSASTIPLLVAGGLFFYPVCLIPGLAIAFRIESEYSSVAVSVDLTSPPVLKLYMNEINIPSRTSDLENDSSFVSAVDTGEEVDDVEVNYVTEAELTSGLAKKQDKLVSGTNIKTINGESILGSGDIVIEGGSSSSSGGAYAEVNHGTGDTTFAITPNAFHVWDEVASLDLSFADEQAGLANEYLFQFTSGATATTLTLPDVKWTNDSAPTIAENMIYQISVLKGLASVLEFSKSLNLIENWISYNEGSFTSGATISFEYPVASDIVINLDYYSSSSVVMPAGEKTMVLDWYEPNPPMITSIDPTFDNIYVYLY